MVDIQKQVDHWKRGAREEWALVLHLFERGDIRHSLFFVHLALEKALKALVCRYTNDLAPKDHNLVRLAKKAGLTLRRKQLLVLMETNAYNTEGRYPDVIARPPTRAEARRAIHSAEEIFQWLIAQ